MHDGDCFRLLNARLEIDNMEVRGPATARYSVDNMVWTVVGGLHFYGIFDE